jgi:hypothetical protein
VPSAPRPQTQMRQLSFARPTNSGRTPKDHPAPLPRKLKRRIALSLKATAMTYLTDRQVSQNFVSKGDLWLRAHDPVWASKIVEPIDIASPTRNPLSQIFGSYTRGLSVLNLTAAEAAECGFAPLIGLQSAHTNAIWNELVRPPVQDAGARDAEGVCAGGR